MHFALGYEISLEQELRSLFKTFKILVDFDAPYSGVNCFTPPLRVKLKSRVKMSSPHL